MISCRRNKKEYIITYINKKIYYNIEKLKIYKLITFLSKL